MKNEIENIVNLCITSRKPVTYKSIDTDFNEELVEYFRTEIIAFLPIFTKKHLGIKKTLDFFKIENVFLACLCNGM